MKRTKPRQAAACLSGGRRLLSVACTAALSVMGHAAFAQDPAPEEVVVTGSRITNTSGMETPVPVTVVTPA
jgi:hypothetical protein